jgi:thioredoxin-related protein
LLATGLLVLAVGILISPVFLAGQEKPSEPSVWVVDEYGEARDPAEDVAEASARGEAEGKRILLEVGGEWCSWCHRLDLFIREHPAIMEALSEGFLIVKVNFSPKQGNEAFLSRYPRISGYPHLFVLESDGTFLHSQDTVPLEEGSSYNEEAILAFLKEWAPGGAHTP